MGTRFGEKLRRARVEKKLTQAQLGSGKYSTSYISLLETGSREPTAEIITELSSRLDIERDVMEAWNTPVSPDEAEFVLLEHRARASYAAHDYADAERTAAEAAALAQGMKNSSAWWNMAFLRAESQRERGDAASFLETAEEVLTHPLTDESTALKVRAETLVSTAYLALGKLHVAVEHALRALEHAESTLPSNSLISIAAQFALLASLTESGQLDDAWRAAKRLEKSVTKNVPDQTAGNAHWAIGNVAFRRQDIAQGLRHHDLAASLLHPASDIELWTRFNKASANMRLSAGVVEAATLACIERAELALSVIGSSGTEALELQLIRSRWQHLGGDPRAALDALTPVREAAASLSILQQGELELLTARCHLALGHAEEAMGSLTAAREAFAEAGATDRAALSVELATEVRAQLR